MNPALDLSEEVEQLLEKSAMRYHVTVCWVACALNPLFVVSDFYNIPKLWKELFILRLVVAIVIFAIIMFRNILKLKSFSLILVPFVLICLQNAVIYIGVDVSQLEGQTLNFMAMFIGAGMFLLWRLPSSILILVTSFGFTAIFISFNEHLTFAAFFVDGGLLLISSGIFMAILVQIRYTLTYKTLMAQQMLAANNKLLEVQALEIKSMNETLERKVEERTLELIKKNEALEEYTFVNSHKLRSPVSQILGLVHLLRHQELKPEAYEIVSHLNGATELLDSVVKDTTRKLNVK